MVYICIECSWKYNSSEENRDNQLSYENSNNANVDHIYERLRTTSFNSNQNLANMNQINCINSNRAYS